MRLRSTVFIRKIISSHLYCLRSPLSVQPIGDLSFSIQENFCADDSMINKIYVNTARRAVAHDLRACFDEVGKALPTAYISFLFECVITLIMESITTKSITVCGWWITRTRGISNYQGRYYSTRYSWQQKEKLLFLVSKFFWHTENPTVSRFLLSLWSFHIIRIQRCLESSATLWQISWKWRSKNLLLPSTVLPFFLVLFSKLVLKKQ